MSRNSDQNTSSFVFGKHKGSLKMLSHLGAWLVVLAWGTSFVSTKVLLDNGLSAVEIYIYRFSLAYILVCACCHKKLFANSLQDECLLMVCGLCGGSIYFLSENTALQYTLTSNVSLITTLAPLLTTLLIGLLYKNERPRGWFYVGSAIALIGVGLIIFKNGFTLKIKPLGDLLALASACSWAIYSVVLRKVTANYNAMFITRKTFFYGLVTALPFLLTEPEISSPEILTRGPVIFNLLFLGLFASMGAYIIWSFVNKQMGALKAANYLYVQPIVTMIFSAIIFTNDPLTLVGCVGCALILVGLWIGDYMSRR